MKCAKLRRLNPRWTPLGRSSRAIEWVWRANCAWGFLGLMACQAGNSMGGASMGGASMRNASAPAPGVPRPAIERAGPESERATPHARAAAPTRVLGTAAPQPASAPDPVLDGLLARCGAGDRALHRAAAKLLTHELLERPLDNDSLVFAVRTSGGPYVKPRGMRLRQEAATDPGAFAGPMREWLSTLRLSSGRRCGIASIQSESGYWLSVVAAEALADVDPLPLLVSPGTRLHFLAHLLVPATEAALVVLGPKGPPRQLPALLAGDRVEASFFLDTPGLHQIQLVVDEAGGPGAAVEAWVAVGDTLPATVDQAPAPGEELRIHPREPDRALFEMLNAARATEGLPPLALDPELARLAKRHAAAMRSSERLAHDLGDGNPKWRLEAEGVHAVTAGENLARAPSLTRAHRAIWASPSHRANLLNPHFDKVGIGVERSARGEWWVCELLADLR